MDNAQLLSELSRVCADGKEAPLPDPKWVRGGEELHFLIPASAVVPVSEAAQKMGFDLLNFISAIDWVKQNKFEVVYHFMKTSNPREQFFLRVELPREGEPTVPSVSTLFDGANWQEREIYDLFGIRFTGHPDLRRILLWEGYPGWPLRKDYVHTPDQYDNGQEIGLPKAAAGSHGAAS